MEVGEFKDEIARIQRDIGEHYSDQKKEFNLHLQDRFTKAEVQERLDSMKKSIDDDLQRKVVELMKMAQEDPRNRVDLAPSQEYSFYRTMAKEAASPAQAKELYTDFLTSHSDAPKVERYQELSSRMAILHLAARIKGKHQWHARDARMLPVRKMWHEYRQLQREFFPDDFYARAFDTQATAEAKWVPDVLGADLMRYLEVRGAVLPNFRSFALPAALWRCPITTGAAKAHGFTERIIIPTTYTDATPAQLYADNAAPFDRVTFDTQKFRAMIVSSGEFIEESIIPMLEWMIAEAMDAIRRAAEDTFINGDRTSPGIDNDILYTAADATGRVDNRILWNGLRAAASLSGVTLSDAAGNTVLADFVDCLKPCGRYALVPSDWLWITSPAGYLDLLDLGDFATVDKIGERATVVTGQIGAVLASPVVISEWVRSDLNTTGYRTAGGQTKTCIIGVHRPSWWIGNWRGITTETDRVPLLNQDYVFAWYSADVQKMRAPTEKSENVIINITAA